MKNTEPNVPSAYLPKEYVQLKHPEWSKNASIYEVNVRQYTPEGTFEAFAKHLPRLKKLGVDIIWLMPVHPIGKKNRKGSLGSYYAVQDYYAVNPEFGTINDLKVLVQQAHSLGLYIILDWVANHSAWDNALVQEHPDWYARSSDGNFQPTPWYDWDDIVDFNYENPQLRQYMTEALKFWIRETDIDGYRCDVAGFVPVDFWENVRFELDRIKPVFMLAEWEARDLHQKAFDMTYAWQLYDRLYQVVNGQSKIWLLYEYIAHHVKTFPKNGYRMNFVDNHDKNSWLGTTSERFGNALNISIVFTCLIEGMPLIYSGQEAGLDRSLAFFDKDLIEWKEHPHTKLYSELLHLKKHNKALWNGKYGGMAMPVWHNRKEAVLAFVREKDAHKVVAFFNFTNQSICTRTSGTIHVGCYTELFSQQNRNLSENDTIILPAWGYQVFVS